MRKQELIKFIEDNFTDEEEILIPDGDKGYCWPTVTKLTNAKYYCETETYDEPIYHPYLVGVDNPKDHWKLHFPQREADNAAE